MQASTFTIYDENAIDHTDRVSKVATAWPPGPTALKQAVDNKTKFSIFQDDEATRAQQQIAAKASQNQEQFSSNVLKPREEAARTSFKIEVTSLLTVTWVGLSWLFVGCQPHGCR